MPNIFIFLQKNKKYVKYCYNMLLNSYKKGVKKKKKTLNGLPRWTQILHDNT